MTTARPDYKKLFNKKAFLLRIQMAGREEGGGTSVGKYGTRRFFTNLEALKKAHSRIYSTTPKVVDESRVR